MKLNRYDDTKYKNAIKSEKVTKEKKEEEWFKENKEAIEQQNERMKKYGYFYDEHRRF